MREPADFDVCVIGGGPAGSATAAQLAAYGHRVLLVDKGTAWRRSRVATLPATVLPLLDTMGVRATLEREDLLHSLETVACWPGPAGLATPRATGAALLHVDRRKFDGVIQDHAARQGAIVLRSAIAAAPVRHEDGCWTVQVTSPTTARSIRCRLLVDASAGRIAPGATLMRSVPATLAISAVWSADRWRFGEGWVEAFDNGWLWSAPIDRIARVVSVFVDAGGPRPHIGARLQEAYLRLVGQTLAHERWLAGARPGAVSVCAASSWSATVHASHGLLRVGDSSVALDPLSSQGILNAFAGALQASVVANTILRRPASADDAIAFFIQRQNQRQVAHRVRAAEQYRAGDAFFGTSFWRARAGDAADGAPAVDRPHELPGSETALHLHPSVRIADVAAIEGDFVVRRQAVITPSGEAVTTVGAADLPRLFEATTFGTTAAGLGQAWSRVLPDATARALVPWLLSRRVLVPAQADHHS